MVSCASRVCLSRNTHIAEEKSAFTPSSIYILRPAVGGGGVQWSPGEVHGKSADVHICFLD